MLERFKVPDADRVYVPADRVRQATEAVFLAMGLSGENAWQAADVLVTNDLRGVETHGVSNMLRSYVAGYRSGNLNPAPAVTTERESGTTALLNADGGLGVHVAPLAMRMAIEKASAMGVASVNVYNVGHMGGAGYHAMLAAEADMIGLAMSTSSGGVRMLPTFGARPMLGTNPIAWAAPAQEMPPFLFDIGTTQIAGNKTRLAQRVGARMLPGWIAAPDGSPIMEEVELPEEYFMLPFGGTREQGSHKGYGFAAIIEMMANNLGGIGPSFIHPGGNFHLAAWNIDAFTDVTKFKTDMDTVLRGLADTPPAPGNERVLYPGLSEAEETERRSQNGIPYHVEVVNWFTSIRAELELSFEFP